MTRVSKAALCAAAMLSACAALKSPPNDLAPGSCNQGVCFVNIDVSSCTAPEGIRATPNELSVDAPNNIQWTITGGNFRFPSNGIVFTDPQFEDGQVTGSGKKFMVKNKFRSHGVFKYTVNLVDGNGTPCVPHDPFVNNK